MAPTLGERLAAIEARIAAACTRAGRARDEVTLVAVSKEQPDASVVAFHALGLRDFGENKVQALGARIERLAASGPLEGMRWHAIGPLQTNKAKEIARMMAASGGRAPALLHTIDRAEIVAALDKRLDPATPLPCLIQVDVDDEPQKAGVLPTALDALVDEVCRARSLVLRGLMAIPRPRDEVGDAGVHRSFAAMRALLDRIADRIDKSIGAPALSLGMSDDFELAIAHGATHVRIGTALFGPRPSTKQAM